MSTPDNKQPLDYATPRREPRKLPVRVRYFVPAVLCFGMAYVGWATAKKSGHVMMPMPDPPPRSDPYWVKHAEDERWFRIGCCSTPLFGIAGLVLLTVSFRGSGSDK